jgi:hypothetical protein
MGDQWITIGGTEWKLPDGSETAKVLGIIEHALENGVVERLELVNSGTGGTATVYLNGRTALTVELDLGILPRPSEISGGAQSGRRLIVGGSEWKLPSGDVTGLLKQVDQSLATGTVARLQLLTQRNRSVTVLLNGKTVETVAVDLGGGPRPSEISGG